MSSDKRLLLTKDKRQPLVIGSLLVGSLVIGGLSLSVIKQRPMNTTERGLRALIQVTEGVPGQPTVLARVFAWNELSRVHNE